MDLNQLKTFVTVADAANLTKASDLLSLSQPAASAQIKALESELGVALFNRSTRGMSLTVAGQALKQDALRALEAARGVLSRAKSFRGDVSGECRIGTISEPMILRLSELLSSLMQSNPNLSLRLSQSISGHVIEQLVEGRLHGGYVIGSVDDARIASIQVRPITLRVVAPYAWRDQIKDADWDDICTKPWIDMPPKCSFHQLTANMFARVGLSPHRIVEVDQESTLRQMVFLSTEPAPPTGQPFVTPPITTPDPMQPSPNDSGAATSGPADTAPPDAEKPEAGQPLTQQETQSFEPEQVASPVTPTPAAPVEPSVPASPAPSPMPVSTNKPATSPDRVAPSASSLPAAQTRFMLANCKVGTEYTAKIEGRDSAGRELEVLNVIVPQGLGLSFDMATQSVTGMPALAGDFVLQLQWRYPGHASRQTGECRLTSNPDPRSLWKVVEPDPALPYQKPHLARKFIDRDSFRMVAASRRGRSHEHSGTFRDDDFFMTSTQNHGWNVLIVADGAGSAEFSREGSRIAVQAAGRALVDDLDGDVGAKVNGLIATWNADSATAFGTEFHYCFHRMATLAVQGIEQAAEERGAPVRSFATTLLAAAVKRDGENTFLATFWMGDGAIAAYWSSGTVKLMGTPDGGEFAGQTRFLDRATLAESFAKRVSIGRYDDLSAVVLMTDGVSDPYFETDNGLADPDKWGALWQDIGPSLESADPAAELVDWLHFFRQGHHDDRTITLLW